MIFIKINKNRKITNDKLNKEKWDRGQMIRLEKLIKRLSVVGS
jgi:hypothetical protein